MARTIPEIQEQLLRYDEVTLLEILEISAEDIVERFVDFIEQKADQLELEFEDDEEDL